MTSDPSKPTLSMTMASFAAPWISMSTRRTMSCTNLRLLASTYLRLPGSWKRKGWPSSDGLSTASWPGFKPIDITLPIKRLGSPDRTVYFIALSNYECLCSVWIGGHGIDPYEQNTQQSPCFGRRVSPHCAHT